MGAAAVSLLVVRLLPLLGSTLGGVPHYTRAFAAYNITPRNFYLAGKAVEAWTPCSPVAPWELSSLVEGDKLPARGDLRMVYTEEDRKWPNKTVPFLIDEPDFTEDDIERIEDVIEELNKLDCVNVRPGDWNDTDYVRITGKKEGCFAEHWGRKGGEQLINLQPPACLQQGTVYHMLFHALGFCHVHNNPIRDNYITILFENVAKGKDVYLIKYPNDTRLTDFGYRYDYDSVMHASRRVYSRNNMDTIQTVDPTASIGQRKGPSYFDLHKLRKLYGCSYTPPFLEGEEIIV